MKKTVLILSVFVLSAFNLVDNQGVKETLVSGKWFVESTQEKGKEPEQASDKEDEWLFFYPDGKIEQNIFGEMITSKWEYDKANEMIKMDGQEGITYLKIIEITEQKLIVEQKATVDESDSLIITYTK